jgi:hypothetical protein
VSFFLTVGPVEYYESVRSDFLAYFEGLETYCVSIEKNHANSEVHIHAFLKFHVQCTCDFLREVLSFFEGTVNVQCCKSRRNVLRYITKEDQSPLFNCRSSELSFAYRANVWCRSTLSWSYKDPFVLEHPQYYRLLREMHSEEHSRSFCRKPARQILPLYFWPGWALELLLQVYKQLWQKEKRAVYLHGLPGVGKTYITRRVLEALGLSNVYLPVCGTFFFGDFKQSTYDSVLFEEWSFDSFEKNYPAVKRIIDRMHVPVDRKFQDRSEIIVRCPIIFISNESAYSDRAFLRRVQVIDALENLENVEKVRVPKMEVDGPEEEVEVIEISSDEDNEVPVPSCSSFRSSKTSCYERYSTCP